MEYTEAFYDIKLVTIFVPPHANKSIYIWVCEENATLKFH